MSRPGLVGRDDALKVLHRAFDQAEYQAEVVVVQGEAGVGKTALLEVFAARVCGEGVAWFSGGSVDVGGDPIPYAPIAELLRDIRRQGLAPSRPNELDVLGRMTGKDRAELFERLLDLLEAVASKLSRVVLVIEDLHWADAATVDFLAFLARNLPPGFLLVLTVRGDEIDERRSSQLGTLIRSRGARISLRPLGREQVQAIVTAVRGLSPTGIELDAIYRRAAGNPFLTIELLAADSDRIPPSVRDLLLTRTRALDDHGWAVAQLAGVIGTRIPHDVLDSAGSSIEQLDDGIRQLVSGGLLTVEDNGYVFRHALMREVVVSRLLPGERRRLHAAVARALATLPRIESDVGLATELATHLHLAHDVEQTGPAAAIAGRLCMSVFAFGEAWLQYRRAIESRGQPSDDDVDLIAAAAEAARWAGDIGSAVDLVRQALPLAPDAPTRARLSERLGQYLWDAGRTEDARAAFADAAAELGGLDESALAAGIAASHAHLHLMGSDAAQGRRLARVAIEMACRADDPRAEGRARITHGLSLAFLGELDAGVADVRSGHSLVTRWGDLDERRRADSNLSYVLLMAGQTGAACDSSVAALALLRRHGLDAAAGAALTSNTLVLLRLTGRWPEADSLGAEALASDIAPGQMRYIRLARAELAIARGDLNVARAELDQAAVLAADQPQPAFAADMMLAEAELSLARNDFDLARRTVVKLASDLPDTTAPRLLLQICVIGLRAQAELTEARQLDADAALTMSLYQRLLERSAEPETPENRALQATAAAEFARAGAASDAALWQQAALLWQELEHPRELAYCRLRLTEALLAVGGQGRLAAGVLRDCWAAGRELGARPLVEAAEALARRARIDLDHVPVAVATQRTRGAASYGLTRRELEVLRALVNGESNRDIGLAMFVSPRTVGVHVSNVLAKLGVSTRGQAAALAVRIGILD